MNEVIAGALAPIILYGNPQGVWSPYPNEISIPTQAYVSETFNLPPTSIPDVVNFE